MVRARLVDQSNPVGSVDIPSVLLSQLIAANLSVLNFPGMTRDGSAHSNLVLGNIQSTPIQGAAPAAAADNPFDLPVTLELLGAGGSLVASSSLTLPYGQTTLIGDVVSYLGVGSLPLGQLRVTRMSGNALMWGILYTVDPSGAVTAGAGANLSP